MPELLSVPRCSCRQLPHKPDCEVAPFFDKGITLDVADEDYHNQAPFHILCPRGCVFTQFEHALAYDYAPTSGDTENTEIPIVCPKCGWSDKQTLPALVGFDPNAEADDEPFRFTCPNCEAQSQREDGYVEIWLERQVLMGVDEAQIGISTFYKGQIVTEFTELSLTCPSCSYQVGETED